MKIFLIVVLIVLGLVMIPYFSARFCVNHGTRKKDKIKRAGALGCLIMGCISFIVGVMALPFLSM